MRNSVFNALRQIAYDRSGISIRENKEALMSARIAKRMRHHGFSSEREYLDFLSQPQSDEELVEFLDAISTNFTSFYREADHFKLLESEAERWVSEGRSKIRLWCAASSTGEEPYTLAITLNEVLARRSIDFRILATDISTRALRDAQEGTYEHGRVAPVAPELLRKYFTPIRQTGAEQTFRVKDELKARVLFKRLNLSLPPFPMRGDLDAVFCRNVMIYFDTAVRQRLIADIERLLRPGGLLVVAHSETLSGVKHGLRTVKPSVYRKEDA
jgi:chemotaxis protein methyltransferase CheR